MLHKEDQGIKKSTDVGINFMLCYADVWNKDKNVSKMIAISTMNSVIFDSRRGFHNFCL